MITPRNYKFNKTIYSASLKKAKIAGKEDKSKHTEADVNEYVGLYFIP